MKKKKSWFWHSTVNTHQIVTRFNFFKHVNPQKKITWENFNKQKACHRSYNSNLMVFLINRTSFIKPFEGIKFFFHLLEFLNLYIFATLIELRIYSLKYQRSTTLGCKDIGIRKSEFAWQLLHSFFSIRSGIRQR